MNKTGHVDDSMFVDLGMLQPGEGANILYYGPAGAGKTWFGGTAGPETLYIDTGDSLDTLKSPGFRARHNGVERMLTIKIREKLGARGKLDRATALDCVTDAIDHALKFFPDRFRTVVLDDATSLGEFSMDKSLEINEQTGKSKTNTQVVSKYNVVIPAMQDYQVDKAIMQQFVVSYKQILCGGGRNFIVIAHQRAQFVEGKKMGEQMLSSVFPLFTGQNTPDHIPRLFSNVWLAEVVGGGNNVAYRARIAGDEVRMAKCRHNGVFKERNGEPSTVIVDPNFLDILSKIKAA